MKSKGVIPIPMAISISRNLRQISFNLFVILLTSLNDFLPGREPKYSPSLVVAMVAREKEFLPPAITRPHDSELPYPLKDLSSTISPEKTQLSLAGWYFKHRL